MKKFALSDAFLRENNENNDENGLLTLLSSMMRRQGGAGKEQNAGKDRKSAGADKYADKSGILKELYGNGEEDDFPAADENAEDDDLNKNFQKNAIFSENAQTKNENFVKNDDFYKNGEQNFAKSRKNHDFSVGGERKIRQNANFAQNDDNEFSRGNVSSQNDKTRGNGTYGDGKHKDGIGERRENGNKKAEKRVKNDGDYFSPPPYYLI